MKKLFYGSPLFLATLIFLSSCGKNDPEPLQSEVKAILLAGAKGSSKSWKLTALSGEFNGSTEEFEFDNCFLDNIYKFTNNDNQTYQANEGATRCNSESADLIESGNWAFTTNGEIVIIIPDFIGDSEAGLFSYLQVPGEVLELTETTFRWKATRTEESSEGESVISYTLTFAKL